MAIATLAEVGNPCLHVAFRPATPITLHGRTCWRTDGNSPVRVMRESAVVFFSRHEPVGHTLRRLGGRDLTFDQPPVPVRLHGDPYPRVGKWIEAIWQEPGGPLHGWYHAEEPACGAANLAMPHIGRALSEDGGLNWHCRGELLRLPASFADCTWKNGFFAGGYGDFSVVPDRAGSWLYLFFSSYHPDESAQGIGVLRLPAADLAAQPELWGPAGWARSRHVPPRPIWPAARGWSHADPDGFWGPAVHYNRALDAYVMLLNRTARGDGDLVQEGIYASVNRDLDDVTGWTAPLRVVHGGAWYPQVVGLEEGCGDAEVGKAGRFFMAGFSAWTVEFSRAAGGSTTTAPLTCTAREFALWFGPDRRCPW